MWRRRLKKFFSKLARQLRLFTCLLAVAMVASTSTAFAALSSWVSGGTSFSASGAKSKKTIFLVAQASYGTLLVNDTTNRSSAKLNSGPNLGGTLIKRVPYSKTWFLDLYAGVQDRSFRNPSTTIRMTGGKQLLFSGGGQLTGTTGIFAIGLGLEAEQLPFVRGTTVTSITVESVLQPAATFTLSMTVLRRKKFTVVTDGRIAYLTAAKWGSYNVDPSTAYGGRVFFESNSGAFRLGLSLSKKSQKTSITSQDYDVPALFLSLGF